MRILRILIINTSEYDGKSKSTEPETANLTNNSYPPKVDRFGLVVLDQAEVLKVQRYLTRPSAWPLHFASPSLNSNINYQLIDSLLSQYLHRYSTGTYCCMAPAELKFCTFTVFCRYQSFSIFLKSCIIFLKENFLFIFAIEVSRPLFFSLFLHVL